MATCYHLARLGVCVLLLQDGELGGGTSAANAGRAQVDDGLLDPLNIRIVHDGIVRLATLEEELDEEFEWRRFGYLCLISSSAQWENCVERAASLTAGGIPTEMLDIKGLRKAEPLLNTESCIGAAYSIEGLLNPFLYCRAYAQAARRLGAVLYPRTAVTSMIVEGHRVVAVESAGERFVADKVAVMCGAWTPAVMRMAGVDVPIRHTHAEAFITEPLPPLLHHTLGLADFYASVHGKEKAVVVGVGPQTKGTLLVTEAVSQTSELHRRTSAWGLSGVATELLRLFPVLKQVRVVRGWGCPTPFTSDGNPIVGWVPQRDNLFIGASFIQTITVIPVFSEWMARMIVGETLIASLDQYSPARFSMN